MQDRHGGQLGNNGYFHIPYRCLTPVGLDNLLIASRAISCDFEAHGATRVMAPVLATARRPASPLLSPSRMARCAA